MEQKVGECGVKEVFFFNKIDTRMFPFYRLKEIHCRKEDWVRLSDNNIGDVSFWCKKRDFLKYKREDDDDVMTMIANIHKHIVLTPTPCHDIVQALYMHYLFKLHSYYYFPYYRDEESETEKV